MTVPTTTNKVIATGNGVALVFPFAFGTLPSGDLVVTLIDLDGIEHLQVENTDYTVQGEGDEDGGSVTFAVAPPNLWTVLIQRILPETQPTDLKNQGSFYPRTIERMLDRVTMLIQQLSERIGSALTLPPWVTGVSTELPAPEPLNLIGWDTTGEALRNFTPGDIGTTLAFSNFIADRFTATAGQVNFTLSSDPGAIGNLDVSIDGVTQVPVTDYTYIGTTLTVTTPMVGGEKVLARYGTALPTGITATDSILYTPPSTGVTGTLRAFLDSLWVAGESAGAALIRFLQAGVGAVARTMQDKVREIEVSVKDFGAVGDGVTDDTTAIQRALDAAGSTKVLRIPKGVYFVTSTLYAPYGAEIQGDGFEFSQFYRTGNYGDTLVFGSATPGNSGGPGRVSDIWFRHGSAYVTGDAALDFKATGGSHLRFYGCQRPIVENCWLWRLPFQIVFEGGSVITVRNCSLNGTYDHTVANLQEGIAQIYLKKSANYGSPTTVRIENTKFNGNNVNARNVTLTSNDGPVVRSMTELIGSQYGLLCDGGEDIEVNGGYFGGFNQSCILFNPGTSAIIDIRVHNVHFDGARSSQVAFTSSGTEACLGVTISSNVFNGELLAGNAISMTGSFAVVANFTISGNACFQHYATNFKILAAMGGHIGGNVISSYNTLNAATTDAQWVAGIYCDNAFTRDIQIGPNVIGGGGNLFDASTGNTYTYKGVEIGSTCVRVSASDNVYTGIRSGSNFRSGRATSETQYVHSAAGNYQTASGISTVLVNKTVGAATAIYLPLYPMTGVEVVVKDDKGDASTNTIFVQTQDGTSIDGVAAPATQTYTTNYQSRRFRFNGTQWNVI